MNSPQEQARIETLRWLVLRALHMAQDVGLSETLALNAVQPEIPDVTSTEMRRVYDYLEKRKLVEPINRDRPVWTAVIGRYGIDIVEYELPCEPGIARPKQW